MKRILLWAVICCCFVVSSVVSAAAALLQVSPGYPRIEFTNPQGITYDRPTGHLTFTAAPTFLQMVQGGTRYPITSGSMSLTIQVDPLGNLVGGVQDLVVNGTVRQPTGAIIHQGLLLRGEILEFGAQDSGIDIDYMDFRLKPTEGILLEHYQGKDIGLTLVMEFSTFIGSFTQNFKSGAKGHLGPIPPKCSGTIGDFVWYDANRNGIQDADEFGIPGVTIRLEDGSGHELASQQTGPNGEYLFEGLCAGDYRVWVDETSSALLGFVSSPTFQGGDPKVDSNTNGAMLNLPTGNSVDLSIDFGYNTPCAGKIGDFVWFDTNRDGIQDVSEAGIEGVTVKLFSNLFATPIETSTDKDGKYLFSGLCAGDYQVEVIPPPGLVPSLELQGDDRTIDSNPNPAVVRLLTDHTTDLTIDFGFNTPCSGFIGDFVWRDLNMNGRQDGNEPGLKGVKVFLLDSIMVKIRMTTTDDFGMYRFDGLCKELYHVKVKTPSGFARTLAGVGDNPAIDSNTSPTPVQLTADNSSDITVDFGFYEALPAIDLEKYTNGHDADTAPGQMIPAGGAVTWTYVVTNTGNVPLADVSVEDNLLGTIFCPKNTLAVNETMTCSASGVAVAGQYANLGTATGKFKQTTVQDSDPSHYFGVVPKIDLEKYVSVDKTNWHDADEAPGILIPVCLNKNPYGGSDGDKECSSDWNWPKYNHDKAKGEHDRCKDEYDRSKSDHDRSKQDHDDSKTDHDNKMAKYDSDKLNEDKKYGEKESAKAAYAADPTQENKARYDRSEFEYNLAKIDCEKSKSEYDTAKSRYDSAKGDYDSKKSQFDKATGDLDRAKFEYDRAKHEWDFYGSSDSCQDYSYDNGGSFICDSKVWFKLVTTNIGPVPLENLALTDSVYSTGACTIPASLAVGNSFSCIIGPFDAKGGPHTNTGTAAGTYSGLIASDSDDANYFGCVGRGTGTPGFWMKHPDAWPVESIAIGGVVYTKTKAIELMKAHSKTDKTYTMFQALVAAKLNAMTCNVTSCIDATIAAADAWMAANGPVGKGITGSSTAWKTGEPLALHLDDYSNGLLCAPSRDSLGKGDTGGKGKGSKQSSHFKNKDKTWPSTSIKIGWKSYSKDEATKHMNTPGKNDVTFTMFRALASAKLNILEGNDKSCIEDTIKSAESWMEKYGPVGKGLSSGTSAWREGEPLFQKMDDYNNGKLCVEYASDGTTSTWSGSSWSGSSWSGSSWEGSSWGR